MNFKIDENLPVEVAELLRKAGHDALTVDEQELRGSPDLDLAQVCKSEGNLNIMNYSIRNLLLILVWLPIQASAMDFDEAHHLLLRTGFGGSFAEIKSLAKRDYEQAVDYVLATTRPQAQIPTPSWADESPFPDRKILDALPEAERREQQRAFRRLQRARGRELKAWWYEQMVATDSPLTERMTLFWHNHFTSSLRTGRVPPQLMLRQNELLRRHALGNFADLLRAIASDPAMLIYLNGRSNRKAHPNENFARELLELFTLGEGHYSEADIKAAARAFTGWRLHPVSGVALFKLRQHDDGEKTFLGHTGHLGGEAIVSILLQQPRLAEFITEKLWREFISPQPDPGEVRRLAQVFRDCGYEIKPLLKALLTSPAFRDPANRGHLIKSPVELVVGTLRLFAIPLPETRQLVAMGKRLGQELLDPPNVKGWPGHKDWITATTLLAREQFLRQALEIMASSDNDKALDAWAGLGPEQVSRILLPIPPVQPLPDVQGPQQLITALVLDPAYQLK